MKKLNWHVYQTEKDGVEMIILTKSRVLNPIGLAIGMSHAEQHVMRKMAKWDEFKFKYSLPYGANTKVFRQHLKDLGAMFRPQMTRRGSRIDGGDDCWYCNEWVEELRECAYPVAGIIPVFNSEES